MTLPWVAIWVLAFMAAFGALLLDEKVHSWRVARRRARARAIQMAHLDEGTCSCHDSWDQCPCAESGHPEDGSCDCCPLGTGLCGPKKAKRARQHGHL